jgi:hypothetical protein
LPTPPGFEHNRGPAYIPFRIQENGRETPARYIRAHLDAPNPFVEGRLLLEGPTYHSEIHAASVHDVDIPPPPITADVTDLQGPPSERTQMEKLRDLKMLAQHYARDRGSCDNTQISYLEILEECDDDNLRLAQMISG